MQIRNVDQLLYSMIDAVRERPGLYLGKKSIVLFKAFLDGYALALLRQNVRDDTSEGIFALPFDGFVWFIQCRYASCGSVKGWCTVLLEHCQGDEGKALELFFRECDLYRGLQPTDCHCAELTEKHRQHIEKHGMRTLDTGIPKHRGVTKIYDLEMSGGVVHVILSEYEDGGRQLEQMLFFADEESLKKSAARMYGPDLLWKWLPVKNLLDGMS